MQNIIAGLIVAAAFGYIMLRLWRLVRGGDSGQCGRCSACHAVPGLPSDAARGKGFVPRQLVQPIDAASRRQNGSSRDRS